MANTSPSCVFCRGPRPSSDPPEHVFPQWVSRALLELPGDGLFHISASDPVLPSFECALIELTTKAVCHRCNHGWMSDLESTVSPILRSAIKGEVATLNARHHKTLAIWAVKNAMMLDCSFGDRGESRFIPNDHCHDLFKTRAPRNITFVRTTSFGYEPTSQIFRHAWAQRFKIEGIGLSTGDLFRSYVVTFQYGYFVTQIALVETDKQPTNTFSGADLALPNGHIVPGERFIQQFWPALGDDIKWPPPVGLEAVALTRWAESGPFAKISAG